MKNTDYAEATGYLRSMEKKILTNASFERALDTQNGEEALRFITQNSEIDFSAIERTEDYEDVLKSELKRVYDMMYNLCPNPQVVSVLSSKYDFHNIKVAVKANALNKDDESLYVHITENEPKSFIEVVAGNDTGSLEEYLVNAATSAKQAFDETKDPQVIDITVDKAMFEHLLEISVGIDSEFVSDYIKSQIDFYNVKTLLRVKNMQKGLKFLQMALIEGGSCDTESFTDAYDKPYETVSESFSFKYFGDILRETMENYEKTGNFSRIEKLTDNYLINEIKASKLVAFGVEPVFSYIVAKENEIKQVRILATCKLNNISADILRERLRDNYA